MTSVRPSLVLALLFCLGIAAVTVHPSPPPIVSAPVRGNPVGFSPGSQIFDVSDAELAADLDTAVDLGARWIRLDVDWSRIEPTEGEYDWASTDRLVEAARDRGLGVLGLLAYAPDWARPPGSDPKHPPLDEQEFASFAAAAARHYRNDIATWEIWNEPNSVLFWEPAPDPVAYARLLTATVAAVREVDGDATLLTGGLAPATDTPGEELSPERFLAELYAEIPTGLVDGIAIHPYSFPADPSDASKDWNLFARLPAIAHQVADAEGRSVPIWLTEFGAPYEPDDPQRQADIVVEGVVCADRWPWAGPVFVYALRDAAVPGELGFGILDDNGTLRPAAERLRDQLATPPTAVIGSPCPIDASGAPPSP